MQSIDLDYGRSVSVPIRYHRMKTPVSASALVSASHGGSFVKCSYLSKKLLRGFESAIGRAHAFVAHSIDVGGCIFHLSALTPHAEAKFFFKQRVS